MHLLEVRRAQGGRACIDPRAISAILEGEEKNGGGLPSKVLQVIVGTTVITVKGESYDDFWARYARALDLAAIWKDLPPKVAEEVEPPIAVVAPAPKTARAK